MCFGLGCYFTADLIPLKITGSSIFIRKWNFWICWTFVSNLMYHWVVTYPFNFISYKKPYVHGTLLGSRTGTFIVIFRRWLEFLLAFIPHITGYHNWLYTEFSSLPLFLVSPGCEFVPFFSAKITILVGEVSDTNNHITGKYSCITFLYWVSVGLFWIAREEENLLKGLFFWIPAGSVSKTQFRETTHPISCLVGEHIWFPNFYTPKKTSISFPEIHLGPHLNSVFSKISCRLIVISLVASQRNSAILQPFFFIPQPTRYGPISKQQQKNTAGRSFRYFLKDLRMGVAGFSFGQATKNHCKTNISTYSFPLKQFG